ncbi:MAG: CaiB/BaiF CoA-transferase family protein [Rhodocyclaceae bacterium]|jgi:alpha-methylacyl-CoA racemase|nr:CaiB/BaiF CoA-transferase family protein [Rhodocyclaceae bacterium]
MAAFPVRDGMGRQVKASGPLAGLKVVEMAGSGPAPFCAMLLSDSGADVVRIERGPGGVRRAAIETAIERGRRSVALDLKAAAGVEACLGLIEVADVLIEGYRPGVMERLGLGPDVALARNPRLVYGRMTGWGQAGPLAQAAGHDPNYLALTGALNAIGPPERPVLPLNILGDFGGGGLYLAFGILSALLHARATGQGQVVDAAIVDGVLSLMTSLYGAFAAGEVSGERAGSGAYEARHFSNVYRCADGQFVTVCAYEPQFYAELLKRTGACADPEFARQHDPCHWPSLKAKLAAIFATRTRDEWCVIMEGSDACFAPVLSMAEVPRHPHNLARRAFIEVEGVRLPAPAPRYTRTPSAVQASSPAARQQETLADWGFSLARIEALVAAGALRQP